MALILSPSFANDFFNCFHSESFDPEYILLSSETINGGLLGVPAFEADSAAGIEDVPLYLRNSALVRSASATTSSSSISSTRSIRRVKDDSSRGSAEERSRFEKFFSLCITNWIGCKIGKKSDLRMPNSAGTTFNRYLPIPLTSHDLSLDITWPGKN